MTCSPPVVVPPPAPEAGAPAPVVPDRQRLLANLRAVVVALDARTVRPDRASEPRIAADASGLRRAALRRIAELERDDQAG